MKTFILTAALSFTLALFLTGKVLAEPIGEVVEPTPALVKAPLLISAYYIPDDGRGFVQVFNTTTEPVLLDGWKALLYADMLAATPEEPELGLDVDLGELTGWIKPRGHIVIAHEGIIEGADITFSLSDEATAVLPYYTERRLVLLPPIDTMETHERLVLSHEQPTWIQWKRSASVTANYLESYSQYVLGESIIQLEGGGLYLPPEDTAGMKIVEVLPNPSSCSPTDVSITCGDYIKLFNPTPYPIELAQYRLRSDSNGTQSSTSNTFSLSGTLMPGHYFTVFERADSAKISLTNSGGYVWLEDTYGVVKYEPISYPDASHETYKDQSWAYDEKNETWRWMVPAPNQPNTWPTKIPEAKGNVTLQPLADCGPGRERNPTTNRCRLVSSVTTAYEACAPGQERNPVTNRCRSVLGSTTTALSACPTGQFRNPDTNRCKSISNAAAVLGPCPTGQERNPATNRCRKSIAAATDKSSLKEVYDVEATPAEDFNAWLITGAITLFVGGYAVYEWRSEISTWVQRVFQKISNR